MYLSTVTGNILNKFNNQHINILYEPQNNLFDVIISQCDSRIFSLKNPKFKNLQGSNMTMVTNDQFDLFNYNVGATNNILGYSTNKKFGQLHLNTLIFTHSYKPKDLKKEDTVLLNNNLAKETKVFFNQKAMESWRLGNSVCYSYGIPLDKFYSEQAVRENKVLLLNIDNFPHIETLRQLLQNNKIDVDIVTTLDFNTDSLRELFNKYAVCIDFNEYNIINLLCSIACGCNAITYATEMIVDNFIETPNLFTARTVQDLVDTINNALQTKPIDHTEYFDTNFSFEQFKQNTRQLILEANNKAYII